MRKQEELEEHPNTGDPPRADRYTWEANQVTQSQCATCVEKALGGAICRAFPDGIPGEILLNEIDHREEYPGDGGVLYSPIEGATHPLA